MYFACKAFYMQRGRCCITLVLVLKSMSKFLSIFYVKTARDNALIYDHKLCFGVWLFPLTFCSQLFYMCKQKRDGFCLPVHDSFMDLKISYN